ncbi:MAG TPA: tetratricopeptide repeat protein, partial [Chroococcales cyanobacterium]
STKDEPEKENTPGIPVDGVRVARPAQPDRSHFPQTDPLLHAIDVFNSGNLDEADRLFFTIADKNPMNDAAFFNLGQIAARRGQIVDALRNFRIAFNLRPDNRIYQEAVADMENRICQQINGKYHVCNYYPAMNDLSSLLNQGVRFWAIGYPEEAKSLFDRVIRLDPNNIDGYYDRAVVEENEHQYKLALQDYSHAAYLLNHPGMERLQGDVTAYFAAMPEATKPPPPLLSSVITSAEDKQFDLRLEINQAISQLSSMPTTEKKKGTLSKLGHIVTTVGGDMSALMLNPSASRSSLVTPNNVDTCDRCQILRGGTMGPN